MTRPRHAARSWLSVHLVALALVLSLASAPQQIAAAKYSEMGARPAAPRVTTLQGGPRPAEALQRAAAWQIHLEQRKRAEEAARKAKQREADRRRAEARAREVRRSLSARVLTRARQLLGVPYVLGGASGAGLDCSGFTLLAYRAAGVALPHYSGAQPGRGHRVGAPRPGDLAWRPGHVAIVYSEGLLIGARRWGVPSSIYADYGGFSYYRMW